MKHQQFAQLFFGSGVTNNYLALVVIFSKIFTINSWSGWTFNEYPAIANTFPLAVIVAHLLPNSIFPTKF
jgi:LytS/YehU family sensor histidine kinase